MSHNITFVAFINAVKLGSGSMANSFNSKSYKMQMTDDHLLLRIQELHNKQCVAYVPMSNVSYIWEEEEENKKKETKPEEKAKK